MERPFDYMMEILFTLVIMMLSISFTLSVFDMGKKYNASLTEEIGQKPSARFTMGSYGENHAYITKTDAYADIMAGDMYTIIKINGADLNSTVLEKARNHERTAVNSLLSALSQTRYRKIPTYNSSGNLVSVNYIGS